jgi:hypothetical protein
MTYLVGFKDMKSLIVNKYISTAVFSLIFAIVFGVSVLIPHTSQAGYDYYRGYHNNDGIYITDFMNYRYDGSYQNNYYPSYPSYPTYPTYPSLYVSCSPSSTNVKTGENVSWTANVSGGNGFYSYNWYGTDNLYGSSQTVYRSYYNTGYKTASVTVTSGTQTITAQCNNSVNVYDNYYYNYNNYYYNQTPVYVSCKPNTNSAQVGSTIVWTAYPSGGNGYYTYSWTGSDGLYGSNQSVSMSYSNSGVKSASVTIYSGNSSITQSCSNFVDISQNYYPVYSNSYNTYGNVASNQNSLDIGCYADPSTSVKVNQPITWIAEVSGGVAPYTYSWTGSDGLTGTESSIVKYYQSSGSKSAVVTVRSADGKTGTRSCTNTVAVSNISSSNIAKKATVNRVAVNTNTDNTQNQNPNKNGSNQAALSFLSLQNVPWGSVAVLVILVLFATVLYLIFNKRKI